jgi:hypothetical protein
VGKINPSEVQGNDAIEGEQVTDEITTVTFIQNLSLMTNSEFQAYLNDLAEGKVSLSEDLTINLLTELTSIADSATWNRLIGLIRMTSFTNRVGDGFSPETWIMQKVRNADKRFIGLMCSVILGVSSPSTVAYLANNLGSYQNFESQVSALLALSKSLSFNAQVIGASDPANASAADAVALAIKPFLDSDNELGRAAAYRAFGQLP